MRARAISDLCQLPEKDFFLQVSIGMGHVLENALRLYHDSRLLIEQGRSQSSSILKRFAEEEAAKFHVLMDAVRCPRKPSEVLNRQLSKFNDHLSKGIYAELCTWRCATLGELFGYVEAEYKEYCLDGPTGFDWIFRNRVLQEREEAMYVDYVEADEEHEWIRPSAETKLLSTSRTFEPEVLVTARALRDIGCATHEALEIISAIWRPIQMSKDFHYQELRRLNKKVLESLQEKALLIDQPAKLYSKVIDDWPFPLYSFERKEGKIKREDLKESQRDWYPEL